MNHNILQCDSKKLVTLSSGGTVTETVLKPVAFLFDATCKNKV